MKLNPSMSHELVKQESIVKYIMGGHGVVTLKSYTGVHHTYEFRAPNNRKEGDDTMFVKTLIAGGEWVYVGMYKDKNFYLTKASKFSLQSPIVKGIYFIMKLMFKPDFIDERMHLYHEGICSRCGRPLTNPESIEFGIGPVCREMI